MSKPTPKKPADDTPAKGPVRSLAVGEAPGEDLGYDPDSIPVEKIPDDDE